MRAQGRLDAAGIVRELRATARHGEQGSFDWNITPRQGGGRDLRARAEELGSVLRAAGVLDLLEGGRMTLTGAWQAEAPATPLLGLMELDDFAVRDAPGVGKLLQAITVYGLGEALSGPGLRFIRLHAPFALTADALGLEDAQAYSASLGLTAKGRILRGPETLELSGTVVPAYALNSLARPLAAAGTTFLGREGRRPARRQLPRHRSGPGPFRQRQPALRADPGRPARLVRRPRRPGHRPREALSRLTSLLPYSGFSCRAARATS